MVKVSSISIQARVVVMLSRRRVFDEFSIVKRIHSPAIVRFITVTFYPLGSSPSIPGVARLLPGGITRVMSIPTEEVVRAAPTKLGQTLLAMP